MNSDFNKRKLEIIHQFKNIADKMNLLNEEGNGNEFSGIIDICGFLNLDEEVLNRRMNKEITRISHEYHKKFVQKSIANRDDKPPLKRVEISLMGEGKICENCNHQYGSSDCPRCEVFK